MSPKKTVDLPKNYTPTEDEEYMNPYQLEYFRLKLLQWREDLGDESLATVKHLQENNWKESDLNDQATVETEASLELRTRDRYRKLINKIDDALERIDKGVYGYCEDTSEPIGIRRLEARPIATLSIEAQERHERFEKSHNED
jgi:DnaK suppressor protein